MPTTTTRAPTRWTSTCPRPSTARSPLRPWPSRPSLFLLPIPTTTTMLPLAGTPTRTTRARCLPSPHLPPPPPRAPAPRSPSPAPPPHARASAQLRSCRLRRARARLVFVLPARRLQRKRALPPRRPLAPPPQHAPRVQRLPHGQQRPQSKMETQHKTKTRNSSPRRSATRRRHAQLRARRSGAYGGARGPGGGWRVLFFLSCVRYFARVFCRRAQLTCFVFSQRPARQRRRRQLPHGRAEFACRRWCAAFGAHAARRQRC